jgi:hypothetical protein
MGCVNKIYLYNTTPKKFDFLLSSVSCDVVTFTLERYSGLGPEKAISNLQLISTKPKQSNAKFFNKQVKIVTVKCDDPHTVTTISCVCKYETAQIKMLKANCHSKYFYKSVGNGIELKIKCHQKYYSNYLKCLSLSLAKNVSPDFPNNFILTETDTTANVLNNYCAAIIVLNIRIRLSTGVCPKSTIKKVLVTRIKLERFMAYKSSITMQEICLGANATSTIYYSFLKLRAQNHRVLIVIKLEIFTAYKSSLTLTTQELYQGANAKSTTYCNSYLNSSKNE